MTQVSTVRRLRTPRLALRRSDEWTDALVVEFFVRNVDHLRRWLPEAEPIARDPSVWPALKRRTETELAAGREERWFIESQSEPGRAVGYVFLTRFRRDGHQSCELSYGIGQAFEGRGWMTEAVACLLDHAETTLGFTRVDARFSVSNERSGRLLERLGFQRIGVAPKHAWLDGRWQDHVLVTRVTARPETAAWSGPTPRTRP